jgi:DNA-binding MarR family transcriptional regulator
VSTDSLPELDAVIHAQARLRVTVALAALGAGDRITFPRLQQLLEITAGNLSTHLRKLEDAGYVEITKTHQRRTPVTHVALTPQGRRAFEDYTTALHALLASRAGQTTEKGYLLDNQQAEAGTRFDALAMLFDPSTFRHIEALGIKRGWRCWEVGAGGPSVPSWLAQQAGPEGYVLATDIDTSWMTSTDQPTYEVRCHDIGTEEPRSDGFDLVHARLVLVHVVQRAEALAAMVRALRPGGWLLVEEADPALQPLVCPDEYGPEQQLANQLKHGFRALMARRGVDLAYGRTLPRLLRDAGLVDVGADAFFPITNPACTLLERATVAQIRDRLVASGAATDEEIDQHLANVVTGRLDLATSPMISAWGRKANPRTSGLMS